jgi:hypothetical protein
MLPAGRIFPVSFSLENSGVVTILPNHDKVWRLQLHVPNAPATSLYFENFYLPEGATLYIYNKEQTQLIGSFGTHNNNDYKLFATEIIYTGDCVVEYYEPASVKMPGSFTITGVANVYNAPEPPVSIHLKDPKCCGFGTAGSCNVNVNCPEGSLSQNQRNAVARILVKNGANQGFCTGALVNTIVQDCKNYFLTANHCGAAASAADKNQWIFYFNYQSTGCTTGAEPVAVTMTGCTMRASSSNGLNNSLDGSDFLLTEISGTIPASYNVFYAGFDASDSGSSSGVSIHHPAGDIKKISTYTTSLLSKPFAGTDETHWQANWVPTTTNYGITEGGSSGSPLFNSSGRVVGKLSGGPSSCTVADSNKYDYYGKLAYDWTSNGSAASQQLKPWLDPANTGIKVITGKTPCPVAGCTDILEPNNTQATAGVIAIGSTYKALIATSTDEDFYTFNFLGVNNLTISLTTLPFDYDLQLLNSSGVVIASSANGGTINENIQLNNLASGSYTVKVKGFNGAFSATNCYTLSLHIDCSNSPEPNETQASATPIAGNSSVKSQIGTSNDQDYYKFSITSVSTIIVSLQTLPFNYDLQLLNSAGAVIASSTNAGTANESIAISFANPGTYTIRVFSVGGAFSSTFCYRLGVQTSTACFNLPEPNETLFTAATVPVNTDLSSAIFPGTDVDYYKFSNTAGQPNLNITLTNLSFDYDFFLYNSFGTLLAWSTSAGTASESIIYNTANVGTYHIKVVGVNGANGTTCYKLRANISALPKLENSRADGAPDIVISPNPVHQDMGISYTDTKNKLVKIMITSIIGEKILVLPNQSHPGQNHLTIKLPSNLAAGIYLLWIDNHLPVKFIRQ